MSTRELEPKKTKSTFDKRDQTAYWMNCPERNMADLFYYRNGDDTHRVREYHIDDATLDQLIANVNTEAPINFCIYLAANPSIPYGEIQDQPSFVPIIQVFNQGAPPNSIEENSAVTQWENPRTSPLDEIGGMIIITKREAERMIKDWKDYLKSGLPSLFFSEGRRIQYTTFDDKDSAALMKVFKERADRDRTLHIYPGFEIPTEEKQPFSFRFIMEIRAAAPDEKTESIFFEFSNPCPPICR